MSLLSTNNSSSVQKYSFNDGLLSILTKDWATAYIIFSGFTKQNKSLPALFNLALCHKQANDFTSAIQLIEQALLKLPMLPITQNQESVYCALIAGAAESDSYSNAMVENICTIDPANVRDRLLRVLVDLYCASAQWQKVIEYGSKLQSKKYANVTSAMKRAEEML